MKKSKKFIAGVMAVCLAGGAVVIPENIVPAVSMTANAEDENLIYTSLDGLQLKYGFCDNGTVKITRYISSSSTDIKLPSIIDGKTVTLIDAFAFCNTDLTSITIPESISAVFPYAFEGCNNLTDINVAENNKKYTDIDGVLFYKDKTTLVNYPIGKSDSTYIVPDGVKDIGTRSFAGCTYLKTVKLPNSITEIYEGAFAGCRNLKSINLPNGIKQIWDGAFSGCNLTSINIPDSVGTIGKVAFSYTNLTEVTLSKNVNYILIAAFEECPNLTKITILNPKCDIYDYACTISNGSYAANEYYFDGTIYGYANSTAQEYAEKNNYNFVVLDNNLSQSTTTTTTTTEMTSTTPESTTTITSNSTTTTSNSTTKINTTNQSTTITTTETTSTTPESTITITSNSTTTTSNSTTKINTTNQLTTITTTETTSITSEPTTTTTSNSTTTTTTTGSISTPELLGDTNGDGEISISDAVLIMQTLVNSDEYKLTEKGMKNADVVDGDGITGKDALAIQMVLANLMTTEDLPVTSADLDKLGN